MALARFSAYFAQAGFGAAYGIVPLMKKEITGEISGNVGAYGNFGGVVYLTIFSLTDAPTLFETIGTIGIKRNQKAPLLPTMMVKGKKN